MVKSLFSKQETQVQSLGQEDAWRRKWQPIPVFIPEKSQRQRNLVTKSWTRLSDGAPQCLVLYAFAVSLPSEKENFVSPF